MRSVQYASCALNYTQRQQADAKMLVLQQESFVDDPGGQGVAGSNPVVPTARTKPSDLVETPGQRASLVWLNEHAQDHRHPPLGTTWGPG
jgi:hypothetical protein